MAAAAPVDADAAALPDGSSFPLSLSLSLSPALPPCPFPPPLLRLLPCSPSPSRSGSLRPASPQPAAATVAACLPALTHSPSPRFSASRLSPALLFARLWIMKFSVALQQFSHALQKKKKNSLHIHVAVVCVCVFVCDC